MVQQGTIFIPFAILVWFAALAMLYLVLPAWKATVVAICLGWLTLPNISIPIPGALPDIDKTLLVVLPCFLGLLFKGQELFRFRPRWFDLPAAIYCLVHIPSSLANDLGFYDGLSGALTRSFEWGLPYIIGRSCLEDPERKTEFAVILTGFALLYVPFCLFEVRFSPQLHRFFYGFHQAPFKHQLRWGGYRPMVFLGSGLAVGIFMANAAVLAHWLWASGAAKRTLRGFSMGWAVIILFGTCVLCKSSFAILAMFAGIGVYWATRVFRTRLFLLVMLFLPPAYLAVRYTDSFDLQSAVDFIAANVSEERAQSFQVRTESELSLAERALERPWFGWGRWGRSLIEDEYGKRKLITRSGHVLYAIPDQYTIISFGQNGLVGLLSLVLMLMLPLFRTLAALRGANLTAAEHAGLVAGALASLLFLYDCMLNAFHSPVFMLLVGASTNVVLGAVEVEARRQVPSPNYK